jgi:hypothetical protein
VAAGLALVLAVSGCARVQVGGGEAGSVGVLRCGAREVSGPLILLAQSVPTASAVPCLRAAPADWEISDFDVQSGRSRIVMYYLAADTQALTVEVTRRCDRQGAEEVTSDELGLRRYDRVARRGSSYAKDLYYLYPGGCTVYRFRMRGAGAAVQANDVVRAFSFIDRDALRRRVSEQSDGRLRLDAGSAP